jgi:hypothetical protein
LFAWRSILACAVCVGSNFARAFIWLKKEEKSINWVLKMTNYQKNNNNKKEKGKCTPQKKKEKKKKKVVIYYEAVCVATFVP